MLLWQLAKGTWMSAYISIRMVGTSITCSIRFGSCRHRTHRAIAAPSLRDIERFVGRGKRPSWNSDRSVRGPFNSSRFVSVKPTAVALQRLTLREASGQERRRKRRSAVRYRAIPPPLVFREAREMETASDKSFRAKLNNFNSSAAAPARQKPDSCRP
jgi:hypothetical protein